MAWKKINLGNTDRELLEYALESMDKDQHYFTEDNDQRDLRLVSYCVKQLSERLAKLPIQEK
jgi:hypothetical protein